MTRLEGELERVRRLADGPAGGGHWPRVQTMPGRVCRVGYPVGGAGRLLLFCCGWPGPGRRCGEA